MAGNRGSSIQRETSKSGTWETKFGVSRCEKDISPNGSDVLDTMCPLESARDSHTRQTVLTKLTASDPVRGPRGWAAGVDLVQNPVNEAHWPLGSILEIPMRLPPPLKRCALYHRRRIFPQLRASLRYLRTRDNRRAPARAHSRPLSFLKFLRTARRTAVWREDVFPSSLRHGPRFNRRHPRHANAASPSSPRRRRWLTATVPSTKGLGRSPRPAKPWSSGLTFGTCPRSITGSSTRELQRWRGRDRRRRSRGEYKTRVRKLPPNYREAVEALERYLMSAGGGRRQRGVAI